MSKKTSEITRFLKWYHGLGDEARSLVVAQVREAFRLVAPKRAPRKKAATTPAGPQAKE